MSPNDAAAARKLSRSGGSSCAKARRGGHRTDRPVRGVLGVERSVRSITAATCILDRPRPPGRASSSSPSIRSFINRRRHLPTVCSWTPSFSRRPYSAIPPRRAEPFGINLIMNRSRRFVPPNLRNKSGPPSLTTTKSACRPTITDAPSPMRAYTMILTLVPGD